MCGVLLAFVLSWHTLRSSSRFKLLSTMQEELRALLDAALSRPAIPWCSAYVGGDLADATTRREAELVEHRGFVHLDSCAGGFQALSHMVSNEVKRLPTTCTWFLHFDDEGVGILVPEDRDDIDPVPVDDVLQYAVYKFADGGLLIRAQSGPYRGTHTDVTAFMKKYVEGTIEIEVGASSALKTFSCYFLQWPRPPKCRVTISCKCVYECLGLNQFSGEWWRWAWAGHGRWRRQLRDFGLERHLLRSAQSEAPMEANNSSHPEVGPKLAILGVSGPMSIRVRIARGDILLCASGCVGRQASDDDTDPAMLPYSSMSAWALLFLLARWSFSTSRFGGMSEQKHRAACEELIGGLLLAVAAGNSNFRLDFDLDQNWAIVWPRAPAPRSLCRLTVSPDGTVDMKDFFATVCNKIEGRKGWWSSREFMLLCESMGSQGTLLELFRNVSTQKKLKPMFMQLLWYLGDGLQRVLLGHTDDCDSGIKVRKQEMGDCLQDSGTMERQLVGYLIACREFSRPGRAFSCTTDKSSVAGLGGGVQATVFALGNTAMLAAPQAPPSIIGSGISGVVLASPSQGGPLSAPEFQKRAPIASRYVVLRGFGIT